MRLGSINLWTWTVEHNGEGVPCFSFFRRPRCWYWLESSSFTSPPSSCCWWQPLTMWVEVLLLFSHWHTAENLPGMLTVQRSKKEKEKKNAYSWISECDAFYIFVLVKRKKKKLRVKPVCQHCVHTGLVGFQAIIDTASGYSWYAMFILAFLFVLRPGGSLKQCQRTCGESGSWQTPCGITPTWKITPRVSRCLKDLNCWYRSSRSHQKAVATMTWCDLIWDCLGCYKQILMFISMFEQVQLKVKLF